jgi:hypothetical protein
LWSLSEGRDSWYRYRTYRKGWADNGAFFRLVYCITCHCDERLPLPTNQKKYQYPHATRETCKLHNNNPTQQQIEPRFFMSMMLIESSIDRARKLVRSKINGVVDECKARKKISAEIHHSKLGGSSRFLVNLARRTFSFLRSGQRMIRKEVVVVKRFFSLS